MSDLNNQTGSEGSSSVSSLGLRWAALRGMLSSPLIEAEEQRSLRDDLVRELQTIEEELSTVPDPLTNVPGYTPKNSHLRIEHLAKSMLIDVLPTVVPRADRDAYLDQVEWWMRMHRQAVGKAEHLPAEDDARAILTMPAAAMAAAPDPGCASRGHGSHPADRRQDAVQRGGGPGRRRGQQGS